MYTKEQLYKDIQQVLNIKVLNSLDAEYIELWFKQYDPIFIQTIIELARETNNIKSIKYIDSMLYNNYKNYLFFKKLMELSTGVVVENNKESKQEEKQVEQEKEVEDKEFDNFLKEVSSW